MDNGEIITLKLRIFGKGYFYAYKVVVVGFYLVAALIHKGDIHGYKVLSLCFLIKGIVDTIDNIVRIDIFDDHFNF